VRALRWTHGLAPDALARAGQQQSGRGGRWQSVGWSGCVLLREGCGVTPSGSSASTVLPLMAGC
jgi:hypothetical protein